MIKCGADPAVPERQSVRILLYSLQPKGRLRLYLPDSKKIKYGAGYTGIQL